MKNFFVALKRRKNKEEKIICLVQSEKIKNDVLNSSKFYKDSFFFENNRYSMSIDGVVLNLKNLLHDYAIKKTEELLIKLYTVFGDKFFSKLEGSFCGFFYDSKLDKCIVFTDLLSNSPIYYSITDDLIVCSNQISTVRTYLKQFNKNTKLDLVGAYSMLTYGYMYADYTLFENIKRLSPGDYLFYYKNEVSIIKYFLFDIKKNYEISANEAIDKINDLFLKAVEKQVNKNKEYGYYNFAPLSGGLDSRMTIYALKEIGAENIVTFTYSETNQIDSKIPAEISDELSIKWLFKNLNNGLDLFNIDEAISITDKRCNYSWAAQLNDFLRYIEKENMGIVHTGVIGDVVIGTFYHDLQSRKDDSYHLGDGAYSFKLLNQLKEVIHNPIEYHNYEEGMMLNRAFNGACLGYSTTFQLYTEALSPFMERQFFEFCLSLPVEMRFQHELYYNWVKKCFPAAAKHLHNGLKIHQGDLHFQKKGKKIYFDTIPSRVILYGKNKMEKRNGMNPIQYWYDSNKALSEYMDNYFNNTREYLSDNIQLLKDTVELYERGTATEKILCISLSGSIKNESIL